MHYDAIYPGKPWYDTHGRRIQAHGASVYYEDGVYYWIGENKQFTHKGSKIWSWGIKAYSSTDLCNWRDEGLIIPPQPHDKKSPLHPYRKLDRPHVIYNPATKKYVAWLKFCDKSEFAIMTADELLGPYTMVNPSYQAYGRKCGDFDLGFDENTNTGYLFVEVDHVDCIVCRLNAEFTAAEGEAVTIYQNIQPPFTREGISHMVRNQKHYVFSSGMTGYTPNPSEVAVSDDWMGPYEVQGNPHENDASSASFNSQISFIFKVEGKDLYVAVADRWIPDDLMTAQKYDVIMRAIAQRSDKSIKVTQGEKMQMIKMMTRQVDTSVANYVWLPIRFDGHVAKIEWHDKWKPEDFG